MKKGNMSEAVEEAIILWMEAAEPKVSKVRAGNRQLLG